MQRSRQQIVEILKKKGKATLEELATHLGLAPITVRAHLSVLERDHLVSAEEVRGKVGRPYYVYSLTEGASELFPRSYDLLAGRILAQIADESGSEELLRLFGKMADKVANGYAARIGGSDLETRLIEFTKALVEEGTMAEWERANGGFQLREYNCPYYRVAKDFPEVCELDRAVISKVLGVSPTVVERMAGGSRCCTYFIEQGTV